MREGLSLPVRTDPQIDEDRANLCMILASHQGNQEKFGMIPYSSDV